MLKYCFLTYEKYDMIFIPDLYFYDVKILPDMNQNDIKNTRKNYKMLKQIFFIFFFLNGPGQALIHV